MLDHIAVVAYGRTTRPDRALAEAVRRLEARGLRVEGLTQQPKASDTSACALLFVEDIASGRRVPIFENRGAQARGCRLDAGGLATAAAWLRDAIARRPDVLFVNRFGRQEADGRGLYGEIAEAISAEIPIVVAIGEAVMPRWRTFSGGSGSPLPNDADVIELWCMNAACRPACLAS
jgi:hypothetical protein